MLAIFSIIASLFISLSHLGLAHVGLAHANQERVAKAKKGSPCAGGSRSCEPTTKGVVCNHWDTILEDSFEQGFPVPRLSTERPRLLARGLTNYTSSKAEAITEDPNPIETSRPIPKNLPPRENIEGAPGYCESIGGSTEFEEISEVRIECFGTNVIQIFVDVWIANPTGCVAGQPCPEYDNSPEYLNVWIDWDGDKVFEENEKVIDVGLTGYENINYYGTMTCITQVIIPDGAVSDTYIRANLGWSYDPNNPCEYEWTWGNVVDQHYEEGKCRYTDANAGGDPALGDGAPRFQNNAGDGINIATGNVYLPQTDFATARDGTPSELNLAFERSYNSQVGYNGPLGYGWTHNYNMHIGILGCNLIVVRRESGQVLYFRDLGNGTFEGLSGVHNKLIWDEQEEQWIFITVNHITYTFDPDGKLLEIKDLHENKLTMTYEAGKLVSVADDFGKQISFEYSGDLITKVTDPGGTSYDYGHDNDNLIYVWYPMGETRLYYYEDPNDPHNLTRIIDENWDDYTTFNYDNNDRSILSRKAADANQIHVDYLGGTTVKVTNSFSQISEYTREIKDGMGYITSISKAQESGGLCSTCAPIGSYEYSDVHTIEGITDARGYESSFSYDDWGNILSKTQAVGTENVRTTTYTYVGAS